MNTATGNFHIHAAPDVRKLISRTGENEVSSEQTFRKAMNDAEADFFKGWLRDAEVGTTVVDVAPYSPEGRWKRDEKVARRDFDLGAIATISRAELNSAVSAAYLVPAGQVKAPLSPLALDAKLTRLGAIYLPIEINLVDSLQPVWMTRPGVQWLAEGEEVTLDSPTLCRVRSQYRTVGTSLNLSRQLLKSGGPAADVGIAAAIHGALILAADDAALVGDGIKEPFGIINSGIMVEELSADFDANTWRSAIERLELAGVDSWRIGAVANPTTKKKLSGITFDAHDLWRDQGAAGQTCGGRPAMVSNGLPTGTLLIGDFSTVTVRHHSKAQLIMRETRGSVHEIFAFLDLAVEVPRPGAFLAVKNV